MKKIVLLVLALVPLFGFSMEKAKIDKNLTDSSNQFAFKLFQDISRHDNSKSVFISPLSASMALSMTAGGADGSTLEEMKKVLGYQGVSQADINSYYSILSKKLLSADDATEIGIAGSIWVDKTISLKPQFTKAGRFKYNAHIESLDFSSFSAPKTINDWCSNRTNGRISEIMDEIDRSVSLLLVNALYFKGTWANPFDKNETSLRDFTSTKGDKSSVEMMSKRSSGTLYFEDHLVKMIELPYGNGSFVMDLILPIGESISQVENFLTSENWNRWLEGLSSEKVNILLPKFHIDYEIVLNETLQELGMNTPFTYKANFSKMSETPLYINIVKQKTFVEVNEEGTEAAAVTAVGMMKMSLDPQQPKEFHADRPFIFVIRDSGTGAILFIGEIRKF